MAREYQFGKRLLHADKSSLFGVIRALGEYIVGLTR